MVNKSEIDAMAKAIRALNGDLNVEEKSTNSKPIGDSNIDAMKKILENFYSSEKPKIVQEALNTEKTDKGTRVGSWEIVINEGNPKTYDVKNIVTKSFIAKDLYLYEACLGIVKNLNEGYGINDRKIKELLDLEEEYTKNRNNASNYKRNYKTALKEGNNIKATNSENRFELASEKALEAQERLLILAGLKRGL